MEVAWCVQPLTVKSLSLVTSSNKSRDSNYATILFNRQQRNVLADERFCYYTSHFVQNGIEFRPTQVTAQTWFKVRTDSAVPPMKPIFNRYVASVAWILVKLMAINSCGAV